MEPKNMVVATALTMLLLMAMFALFSGGTGHDKKRINTRQAKEDGNKQNQIKTSHPPGKGSSISSTNLSASDNNASAAPIPPVKTAPSFSSSISTVGYHEEICSKDELEQIKKDKEEAMAELVKAKEEWIQNKINDESLDITTREKYKLLNNQQLANGTMYMRQKRYSDAVKQFNEVVNDETATPLTRYFALESIENIAKILKNKELYFTAARMRGKLVATEDLSVIGQEKKTDYIDWIDESEKLLNAKSKPEVYDRLLQETQQHYGDISAQRARDILEEKIKDRTLFFGEFI
ncbi:hypothetical protein MASR1M12_40510 [Erysipelotrichia bacterium]|jgi:hypothetical protein